MPCAVLTRAYSALELGLMCGIVGYVGPGSALEVLIGCLQRLEYRGYDSAGISVISGAN